jgi:hypothetical protein
MVIGHVFGRAKQDSEQAVGKWRVGATGIALREKQRVGILLRACAARFG